MMWSEEAKKELDFQVDNYREQIVTKLEKKYKDTFRLINATDVYDAVYYK